MDGRTEGRTDRQTDRRTDELMVGQRQAETHTVVLSYTLLLWKLLHIDSKYSRICIPQYVLHLEIAKRITINAWTDHLLNL